MAMAIATATAKGTAEARASAMAKAMTMAVAMARLNLQRKILFKTTSYKKLPHYFFFRGHGNESCNLIGSLPGQYFPISAHGQR